MSKTQIYTSIPSLTLTILRMEWKGSKKKLLQFPDIRWGELTIGSNANALHIVKKVTLFCLAHGCLNL